MSEYTKIPTLGKGNLFVKEGARVDKTVRVHGDAYIDEGSSINERVDLYGGEIHIGKYCAIARDIKFQGINHEMSKPSICLHFYRLMFDDLHLERPAEPIVVGNDVWIGTGVIILPGVTIGDGAVIGAGAIVTKNVDPYSITVGNPAKHIKWRYPEQIIKQLIEIKWWDWDKEKIRRNRNFFSTDLNNVINIKELII